VKLWLLTLTLNQMLRLAMFKTMLRKKDRNRVYKCARRDMGLCMVPCFVEYHTKVNL